MTDRELFEFINVEDMLIELGIRNVRNTYSGEIEFSCPFPGHSSFDSHPSATMSVVERPIPDEPEKFYPKTSFYCFTCGAKGSAISFLAEYEGVSPVVAKRFLRERFAPDWIDSEASTKDAIAKILEEKKEVPKTRETQKIDRSVLDRFWVDWSFVFECLQRGEKLTVPDPFIYMVERGFELSTLIEFDIGFDETSSRITIPVFDHNGELVGFKGRAWWADARPKYLAIGGEEYGFDTYEMARFLFALDKVSWSSHVKINTPLIVREGELNAMMLHQLGYSTAVGVSGNRLSNNQIGLIKKYASKVTVWFDELKDSLEAASKLESSMPVSIAFSERDPVDDPDGVTDALASAESSLVLRVR